MADEEKKKPPALEGEALPPEEEIEIASLADLLKLPVINALGASIGQRFADMSEVEKTRVANEHAFKMDQLAKDHEFRKAQATNAQALQMKNATSALVIGILWSLIFVVLVGGAWSLAARDVITKGEAGTYSLLIFGGLGAVWKLITNQKPPPQQQG